MKKEYKSKINLKKLVPVVVMCMASILNVACKSSDSASSNQIQSASTLKEQPASVNVAFETSEIYGSVGEVIEISLNMKDLPTIEGGGISLSYDPSKISVKSVSVDTEIWGFVNRNGEINNSLGKVNDILFSSYEGVLGESSIATIIFDIINPGDSEIAVQESAINPFASDGEVVYPRFGSLKVIAKSGV